MGQLAVVTDRSIEKFMTGELPLGYFGERGGRADNAVGVVHPSDSPRVLRAMVAMEAGVPGEMVAKYLDWRDFERFCARLLTAKGFDATLDVRLKRPRAQIDILARSSSISLLIDCKHWARGRGSAGLAVVVEKQAARARLVRSAMKDLEPMAIVVISLAEERPRFVGGAAVVPLRTLGDFIDNVHGYSSMLTFY